METTQGKWEKTIPTFQYVSLFAETQQLQLYFQIMTSLYVGENWKKYHIFIKTSIRFITLIHSFSKAKFWISTSWWKFQFPFLVTCSGGVFTHEVCNSRLPCRLKYPWARTFSHLFVCFLTSFIVMVINSVFWTWQSNVTFRNVSVVEENITVGSPNML